MRLCEYNRIRSWCTFCKTTSNSATWAFDRFRLYTATPNTWVRVLDETGAIVDTQPFHAGGGWTADAFEHDFTFDLSGNTGNAEYTVMISGVPQGAQFAQIYTWPTGFGSTRGLDADITYWNFNCVNITSEGITDGYIRFENQPITAVDGAENIDAKFIYLQNSSLSGAEAEEIVIGADNSGITGGTIDVTGISLPPSATTYYDSLIAKSWNWIGDPPSSYSTSALVLDYDMSLPEGKNSGLQVESPILQCNIDWGDGTSEEILGTYVIHEYATTGTYRVVCTPNDGANRYLRLGIRAGYAGTDYRYGAQKLTTVVQFGNTYLANDAFGRLDGLQQVNASDVKTSTSLSILDRVFYRCTALTYVKGFDNPPAPAGYGVSRMFEGCSALTTVDRFNIDGMTTLDNFMDATDANSVNNIVNLPTLVGTQTDFNAVTSMVDGFYHVNVDTFPYPLNFSSLVNGNYLFGNFGTPAFTAFAGSFTFGNRPYAINGTAMFSYCSITSVPTMDYYNVFNNTRALFHGVQATSMPNAFDLSGSTDCGYMFRNSGFTSVNILNNDLSSATACDQMFAGTSQMTTVPNFTFNPAGVVMNNMFYQNSVFTGFDTGFDFSKATDCTRMFTDCYNLESAKIPTMDMTMCTDFTYIFDGCSGTLFTESPTITNLNVTSMSGIFDGCSKITSVANFATDAGSSTALATTWYNTFRGCLQLTSVPVYDYSAATHLIQTFYQTNITSWEGVGNNFNNVRFLSDCFYFCSNLAWTTKSFPALEGATDFLQDFGTDTHSEAVWDAQLIEFDNSSPNSNVTVGAAAYHSATSDTARANLIARGWTINDGGVRP